jgi:hypothetical protein
MSYNDGPRRLADRPDRGTAVMPVTGVQLGRFRQEAAACF